MLCAGLMRRLRSGFVRRNDLWPTLTHPFYELHRDAMEAAMRQRLDLADAMLRERAHLSDIDASGRR